MRQATCVTVLLLTFILSLQGSLYETSNLDRGGSNRKKKIEEFSRSSREKLVQSKNKMFSKFTSILQHAVEALAPSLPLQEDFVYHWKAITHYYIETSDDKAPVTDTNIPSHLEQMLDILTQEEGERESGETGPCMEYLLHHKILETLYTLGKADVRQSCFVSSRDEAAGSYLLHKAASAHSSTSSATHQCPQTCTETDPSVWGGAGCSYRK